MPLRTGGPENISLQIRSDIIGIFSLKFSTDDKTVLADRQIQVVIGRINVEGNIILNVSLSMLLGFVLFLMGMEIDFQQVLEYIK